MAQKAGGRYELLSQPKHNADPTGREILPMAGTYNKKA
jgi:hypothetical protein